MVTAERIVIREQLQGHINGTNKNSSGIPDTARKTHKEHNIYTDLNALLNELREFDHTENLYSIASKKRPHLIPYIKYIEKFCTELKSDICELIYLLRNSELSLGLSNYWLNDRLQHFYESRSIIESNYVKILFEIQVDKCEQET